MSALSGLAQSGSLGTKPLGSSVTQPVTVVARQAGTVFEARVLTFGQSGKDFTSSVAGCVGTVLTVGGLTPSCAQPVTFAPTAPGMRLGVVALFDINGVLLGETPLNGTGKGGLAVLSAGNTVPFAGNGNYLNVLQDNISALTAELHSPTSVAMDGAGNLYIADSLHNRIRMVCGASASVTINGLGISCAGKAGVIFTIAGGGNGAGCAISCPATDAELDQPGGIAIDGAGNLYIADTGNNLIRKVSASTGRISTVAGSGSGAAGFGGDGVAATDASVFLDHPQGVAVDAAGNLLIADTNNHIVRKVTLATNLISTVTGIAQLGGFNGDGPLAAARLNTPYALAVDTLGRLVIADTGNHRIRVADLSANTLTTVAGDGTPGDGTASGIGDGNLAINAELNAPTGIAIDPAGNYYISDTQDNRIRKVNAASQTIATLTVSGQPYLVGTTDLTHKVSLNGPQGLLVDPQGNVFYADTQDMQIWKIAGNLAALDFTSTPVRQGSGSVPLNENVENVGNDVATAFLISAGTNAASPANSCGASLAVSGRCTLSVRFTPASAPVLLQNTTESGTVAANYSQTATVPASTPLQVVAVGIALPLNSTSTTLASSPNPSLFRQIVTFSGQVATGNGTLTGTVALSDTYAGNTVTLVSGLPLTAAGAFSYSTATLAVGTHVIVAAYSGDASHPASSSTDNGAEALSQFIEEQTAITLKSSAAPSLVGQSVTFTATVTTLNGGTIQPDGTVTFLDGNTLLAIVPVTSGTASYTTAVLTNGMHPITAVYSGDVSKQILGETSEVFNQDVQLTTSLALVTSGSPSYYGNPVTLTATATSASTQPASGVVNFYDNNAKIGSATLSAGAPDVAQLIMPLLALGTHSITATYAGDSYNTAAFSLPVLQVVVQTTTGTTLAAVPSPGIAGAPVTLTASVNLTNGAGTPTGLVTFSSVSTAGTVVLGSANLSAAGTASIAPVFAPGSYSLVASYAGDTNDAGSQSLPLPLTVNQAVTATALLVAPNPSTLLQPVTFTATVTGSGATPTGIVNFYASGNLIGFGTLNHSAVATLTYAALPIGAYPITAAYQGDANDAPSTSPAITLNVGLIPTTTNLGYSVTTGANPQLNLVSTVMAALGAPPTGTVTFTNAQTTLGTATLDATGLAALAVDLPAGTYVITATYSGDATHLASTSLPITAVSNPIAFKISITPSTLSLKTTQYAQVGVILTSVGSFTDKIGFGCASLPVGVTCHFSSPTVQLAANGNATEQLTIDTNSPLTGGTQAMNRTSGDQSLLLAGVLLPFSLLFGWIFRRQRTRWLARLASACLLMAAAAVLLSSTGCSGIGHSSAVPGTYTIQFVATGTSTGVTETQNIALTITQ